MDEQKQSPAFLDKYLLPASILVAAVLIAGSVLYSTQKKQAGQEANPAGGDNQPAPAEKAAPPISASETLLGKASAPVAIIEYGDYQCPWCGKFFTEVEPMIRKEYIQTGKAKMVFRSFQFLGPESKAAAEAVECAREQGKSWEYHDAVYKAEHADGQENNGNLDRELFLKLAGEVKLDVNAFTGCLDAHKFASKVQSDYTAAGAAGVNGTPTVFINGKLLGSWTSSSGNPFSAPANLDAVRSAINSALAGK